MDKEYKDKPYGPGVRDYLTCLETNGTNVDKKSGLEIQVDACSCMSCGCFKSPWTIVLSPAGIAAGLAAFATASTINLGS